MWLNIQSGPASWACCISCPGRMKNLTLNYPVATLFQGDLYFLWGHINSDINSKLSKEQNPVSSEEKTYLDNNRFQNGFLNF